MAQDNSNGMDVPPVGEQRRRRPFSRRTRIFLGASVCVVALAMVWRSVYRANQRELFAQRRTQQEKMLAASLTEVPGRRFLVTDVNPEVLRKNALLN